MERMQHDIALPGIQQELQEGQIRLLKQISGTPPATGLQYSISVHSISDLPPYIALSYAWHDDQTNITNFSPDQQIVTVDGNRRSVTPNLLCALHHLAIKQPTDQPVYAWIDSICIDQEDPAELTAQVAIMHRIYRNAAQVLVWLGPDHEKEAYTVREFFRALLQQFYHEDDCSDGSLNAMKYKEDAFCNDDEYALKAAGLPPLDTDIWRKVVRFWDRSWFSRVWVQQEVAMARHIRFCCGDVDFFQDELVEVSRFFSISGLGEALLLLRLDGQSSKKAIQGRKIGCSAVRYEDLQTWAAGYTPGEALDFRQAANRLVGPLQGDLETETYARNQLIRVFAVELFLSYRDDASDPRDRVYALLVLMSQIAESRGIEELPLKPDYSKTVDHVYLETTSWLVEQTGWLGVLGLLHPRRDAAHLSSQQPSWVPDFTSPPPRPLAIFRGEMTQTIETQYAVITSSTKPTVHGSRLIVSVKPIGTVASLGDTYDDMIEDGNFELSAQLLLQVPEIIDRHGRTRVDMWIEALKGQGMDDSSRAETRLSFRHWTEFFMLRKMIQDFQAGVIKGADDHLKKMPGLEALATADSTGTIPNRASWVKNLSTLESQTAILQHRPSFRPLEIEGRRLVRLIDLGFESCPAATILAVGPENLQPGDKICLVSGSPLPLALRPINNIGDGKVADGIYCAAQVIGEAFITEIEGIDQHMKTEPWKRWELD